MDWNEEDEGELRVDGASANVPRKEKQKTMLQQRPASFRLPNRPQSGGLRRPEPTDAPVLKPRPGTAREGARTLPVQSFTTKTCFEDTRDSNSQPEDDESVGIDRENPEFLYIQALKQEILHLHHLLEEKTRSCQHVKNVQSIRDIKMATDSIRSQLARYNFSSDPSQLIASKRKLESLLGDILFKLIQKHMALEAEASMDDQQQQQQQQQQKRRTIDGRIRGYGSSTALVFTSSFLEVLEQAEGLKTRVVALQAEKTMAQTLVQDKALEIDRLKEQMVIFKDALAKSKPSTRHVGWATLQSNWRKTVESEPEAPKSMPTTARSLDEGLLESEEKMQMLENALVDVRCALLTMENERNALVAELQESKRKVEEHEQTVSSFARLEEAMQSKTNELEALALKSTARLEALEKQLKTANDRFVALEQTSLREKHELRREKNELETALRRIESELHERTRLQSNDQELKVKEQAHELEKVRSQLHDVEQRAQQWQKENVGLQMDVIAKLQRDLEACTRQRDGISLEISTYQAKLEAKDKVLEQTEQRLATTMEDLERQTKQLQHHENQLQLLESKLHRSLPVEDEEAKHKRALEENNWHQKLAALEHALTAERQQMALLQEQHLKALELEREKANHAHRQVKSVTNELETANLCLAERKKQRDKELIEFEAQKHQWTNQIRSLEAEVDALKQQRQSPSMDATWKAEMNGLHKQMDMNSDQLKDLDARLSLEREMLSTEMLDKRRLYQEDWARQLSEYMAKYDAQLQALADEATQLKDTLTIVSEERDALALKLEQILAATPRSSTALSEARVELQKAKQKINALEEKLAQKDSSRAKDLDSKLATVSSRERRAAEELKMLKKQKIELSQEKRQLQKEREALEHDRSVLSQEQTALQQDKTACTKQLSKMNEDKQLMKQIVSVVAKRLQVQMDLCSIVPPQMNNRKQPSQSLHEFLVTYEAQNKDEWRKMATQWQELQQSLDDLDWQLVHMKNRLEELALDPSSVRSVGKTPLGIRPFSDAVAAGKQTLPVAQQLSLRTEETSAPREEEHETFAIALTKEMKAMKESYEAKMEELLSELKKTQKLRVETTQRLRSELEEEKRRSHQVIVQLTQRCEALEAQLAALQKTFSHRQDQEIELLEKYSGASDETFRREIMHSLFELIATSCREEMALRNQRQQERMAKLHAYCGSSSVTVERDDKKQLQ